MIFTVMSYNVERGFHTSEHVFQEPRLQAAQRAVQLVNPDILALTEACYGGENLQGIFMDYRSIFKFPYGKWGGYRVFGPRQGDEGGNCLLSNLPLQAEVIHFSHKGAVRGKIKLEDKILNVDVVHPSHSIDDLEKISELSHLVNCSQAPYIITGDFNTLHPEDKYDFDELSQEFTGFDPQKVMKLFDNWKKAECVSWILQQGLADSFPPEARRSTVPTFYAYGRKQKGVRLDFTFHTSDLKAIEAYVLKNEDTETASDHYPIVVRFEI